MHISLIILALVLIGIAMRRLLPLHIPIWLIMLTGGLLCVIFHQITALQALHSLNADVLLYLFGVFILSSALEHSGWLTQLSDRLFHHANTRNKQLLVIVFGFGLLSAFFMNDTVAIIGTPIILQITKKQPKVTALLLMALAYSVTIGSVFSPIGNPQNLLIANHIPTTHVFNAFITYLAIPTGINLALLFFFMAWLLSRLPQQPKTISTSAALTNQHTVRYCRWGVSLFIAGIITKWFVNIPFAAIALVSAIPIMLFSRQRWRILAHIDWGTLLFFIGLFILMQSVWNDGSLQTLIQQQHINVSATHNIFWISTVFSQLISNVPMVALYLPLLHPATLQQLMALAASSTLAGNCFLFGAASNIIIAHNAEKRGHIGIPFWSFFLYGAPLTIISLVIYWLYLHFLF